MLCCNDEPVFVNESLTVASLSGISLSLCWDWLFEAARLRLAIKSIESVLQGVDDSSPGLIVSMYSNNKQIQKVYFAIRLICRKSIICRDKVGVFQSHCPYNLITDSIVLASNKVSFSTYLISRSVPGFTAWLSVIANRR